MAKEITLPQKGIMALVSQNHLSAVESALAMNDLSKLDTGQRISYYNAVCQSVGLNPLTQPFAYIILDGKLTLYARKECSEQLRKINSVSIQIVSRTESDDYYEVHVRAMDKHGRTDEDISSLYLFDKYGKRLTGLPLANARMKAVTKAKRRVTLAISGLGVIDESEFDTISEASIQATQNPQMPNAFGNSKIEELVPSPILIKSENAQEQEPEPLVQNAPQSELDNYVIGFGKKMMNKKLHDFTDKDHLGMIAYLDKGVKESAKPLSGKAAEYHFMATQYLKSPRTELFNEPVHNPSDDEIIAAQLQDL